MRIVTIDGSVTNGSLTAYLAHLRGELEQRGHDVCGFTLRDLELKYCTGCWSCWWGPTCGECVAGDDSGRVWAASLNADVVLIASPLVMGFVTALTKQALDKIIVLVHPYIRLQDGEMCHHRRYDRYPDMALLLEKGADADDEDVALTKDIIGHSANNIQTRLRFSGLTDQDVKEVADALTAA
jgi:multimeric flavodoxin WrbA